MNSKNILAVLASTVAGFLFGGLVYAVILAGFFKANTIQIPRIIKDPPVLVAIAFANLCFGILFTWILKTWNVTNFFNGFIKIALVGLLIGASFDLFLYATLDMYKNIGTYIVDIVCNGITCGVMGGVAALILGAGKKQAA